MKKTILLVDDDSSVVRLFSTVLRHRGYAVREATSPRDAIELFCKCGASIDLLITDVLMPEIDGCTLAQHFLRNRPELPVLFITGTDADRVRRFNENAERKFTCLLKPCTPTTLSAAVDAIWRKPETQSGSAAG